MSNQEDSVMRRGEFPIYEVSTFVYKGKKRIGYPVQSAKGLSKRDDLITMQTHQGVRCFRKDGMENTETKMLTKTEAECRGLLIY